MIESSRLALIIALTAYGFAAPRAAAQSSVFRPLPAATLVAGRAGDLDYEYTFLRSAIRTSSGELITADATERRIRVFDAAGRLRKTFGRRGGGPGEFQHLGGVFLVGDTLAVPDWILRRLSLFQLDGTLIGTARFPSVETAGWLDFYGRLPNGLWVAGQEEGARWTEGPGLYRDALRIVAIGAGPNASARVLATRPGRQWYAQMPASKSDWKVGPMPFASWTAAALLGRTIILGETAGGELEVLDDTGAPLRTVKLDVPAWTRDPDAIKKNRRRAFERAKSDASRAFVAAIEERALAAGQGPRWHGLTAGSDGRLWISIDGADDDKPSRLLALDPATGGVARWQLPARHRLVTADRTHLLVAVKDDDDVERLGVVAVPNGR